MIKLLLLDFDGIMTANRKFYDKSGVCTHKETCDRDWTSIKRFRAAGIPVEFLTGDPFNEEILHSRNIPCIVTRGKNKEDYLPELCETHSVSPENIAYLGDDLFDIGLLKEVGYPFCPEDATKDIFTSTKSVCLFRNGGDNLIEYLFYWCRENNLIPRLDFEEEYAKILKLDEREKF